MQNNNHDQNPEPHLHLFKGLETEPGFLLRSAGIEAAFRFFEGRRAVRILPPNRSGPIRRGFQVGSGGGNPRPAHSSFLPRGGRPGRAARLADQTGRGGDAQETGLRPVLAMLVQGSGRHGGGVSAIYAKEFAVHPRQLHRGLVNLKNAPPHPGPLLRCAAEREMKSKYFHSACCIPRTEFYSSLRLNSLK
jgi:hypothetical protein